MSIFRQGIKVLVVDDFSTMRRIVKTLLRQCGINDVIEAENGEEALNALRANPTIDLIISDWNMPTMTGLEFLKAVRAEEKWKHLPFLMITAEAEKENIVEAVKAGVTNYIVKPFTGQTLMEKLRKIEGISSLAG